MSESDDQLIERLREAAKAADPVPDAVIRRAKSALGQRHPDAEIARITDASRRSGTGRRRRLRFETASLRIDVEVWATGDRRRIVGQLVPPQQAVVELRTAVGAAQTSAEADEHGRFEFDAPAGPLSLSCRLADDPRTVDTEWIPF